MRCRAALGSVDFGREVLIDSDYVLVLNARHQYDDAIDRFQGFVLPLIMQFSDCKST